MFDDITENLHPNLQNWFDGQMLYHPYVRQYRPRAETVNEIYAWKKAEIAKAVRERDWQQFVFLHERPDRPHALQTLMRKYHVSLAHLWPVIGSAWSDTEIPSNSFEFWHKIWSSSCPHRNSVMEPEERVKWEALPDEFSVWRGVNDGKLIPGFSWTLDRARGRELFGSLTALRAQRGQPPWLKDCSRRSTPSHISAAEMKPR